MLRKLYGNALFIGVIGLILMFSGCASLEKAEQLNREGQTEQALDMAAKYLADEDPQVRVKAIYLIGDIDHPRSGKLIVPSLKDSDSDVRKAAIVNIGKLRYAPGAEKMVKLVPDARGETFDLLAKSFRQIGEPGMTALVENYDSSLGKGNQKAFRRMFQAVGADIADALIKTLAGKSAFENRDKFEILIGLKNPKVSYILVEHIDEIELGELIVEGLVKMGTMSMQPTFAELKRRMKNPTEDIVGMERLVIVLGRLKDTRAIDILEQLSTHESERLRDAAGQALLRIRGF